MRLLVFAILCMLAILLIRRMRRWGSRGGPSRRGADRGPAEKPAIAAEEIVDVPYEECDRHGEERSGAKQAGEEDRR